MRHTCGAVPFDWRCAACVRGVPHGVVCNARFWVWRNGWVKLTLRPEQQLSSFRAQRTEEGWASEAESWEHTGTHVVREWCQRGRDCDGVLEQCGMDHCPL